MRKFWGSILLLVLSHASFAQDTAINPSKISKLPSADKIIAIVGDNIILQSDLEGELQELQTQSNTPLPQNAPCAILEQMIAQKALVIQAERDSLPVSDDEVEGDLENKIRGFINEYGSQQKLEQIAGMSVYQLKEKFREPIREQLLADAERKKIIDEVKITPTEVEDYFNHIPKDSLPFFESEVEVGQIVITPKADPEVEEYTLNQLKGIKKQIDDGSASFVTMMNLYSQDPSSKQNDGTFTITKGDKTIDPNFMAAAFRLKNGEISDPVKSKFGYHLIQMVRREGDNAEVRDLLLIPDITSIDLKKAENKLDSIRADIIAGKLSFGEAAVKYSDDPNAKMYAGMFAGPDGSTFLTIDQLDPGVVLAIDSLKPGQITSPTTFTDDYGKKSTRIIYLESRSKPHRENLNDDYDKIQQQALQQKQYAALSKWFSDKMRTFYIMVDNDYKNCTDVEKWAQESELANKGD
jgi:peptidyl-prolyl cis-trans isomerase SurA